MVEPHTGVDEQSSAGIWTEQNKEAPRQEVQGEREKTFHPKREKTAKGAS